MNCTRFASRGTGYFDLILVAFCVVLVVSNVVATKGIEFGSGEVAFAGIQLWPIITDGGAFLFPLAYVLGDVISEVYGLKAAKRAIVAGFVMSAVAAGAFVLVQYAPPASWYKGQSAYETVLGVVPQILLASLAAFAVGQFLNSWVLVKMKARAQEKRLWQRLAGSTLIGETADTLIFCAIAAPVLGIDSLSTFWNYVIVGVVYKVLVEIAVSPLTVAVIGMLKRREASY